MVLILADVGTSFDEERDEDLDASVELSDGGIVESASPDLVLTVSAVDSGMERARRREIVAKLLGAVLEVGALGKRNCEVRSHVVGAEPQTHLEVLVAEDLLVIAEDGVFALSTHTLSLHLNSSAAPAASTSITTLCDSPRTPVSSSTDGFLQLRVIMADIMSAAVPVGSIIFSVFALLIISVVVLLILRHYLPLRTTPAFYLVPIFFALWLPVVAIILVPIDLASSAATDDEASRGIWLPQRVILVSFILPILAEYSDAGYRDPNDKLRYSLRQNAQFYAMVAAAGLVGLVYVAIAYRLTFDLLKGLVMALAYCWGLFLAIYLMGHGLVSIPRQLIRSASISGRLRRLQTRAPITYDKMEDALVTLQEIELQVSELGRRKTGTAMDFQDWIEELQDIANIPLNRPPSSIASMASQDRIIPTVITEKYLADLTRKLIRARHARSRYVDEWNQLVQEASEMQAILDSAASKKLDFGHASPHAGFWDTTTMLTPYTRYLCYYHVMPYARLGLGVFLAVASACIVWSEFVKLPFPILSVVRLSVIHHWVGDKAQVGFAGQMISAFWICYMCAAALTSMTEVKVWRGRALVKRNTAHEAAFWYATQVAKLCVPLSYNFLTLLTPEVYTKTTFYNFLGRLIDFTDLGRWFDDLFPLVVLVPVIATLFGVYGKVKRFFVGIDIIDEEDGNPSNYGTGSWREGRDLIERELGGNSLLRRREDAVARLAGGGAGGGSAAAAGRAAPVLSIPTVTDSAASPARSPVRSSANARRPGGQTSARVPFSDEPPEDDNIFQILGHRMKNTMDTIETPKWMQDFGSGIKKPKWMGGGSGSGDGGGDAGTGSGQGGGDIRRWFGGAGGGGGGTSTGGGGAGQIRI
ncbi:LMBR1 domain-containing protein [Purpureocillium lavendulum]|uniref:LMBR1 domain-containing protein n=1 Tax=Purpureocillium lavendulum TaxID=1247861 RepID=A0AB34G5K4_9HYPO|nr:LMBR1 domain-containing protein [Purpureocillium lavendulum]